VQQASGHFGSVSSGTARRKYRSTANRRDQSSTNDQVRVTQDPVSPRVIRPAGKPQHQLLSGVPRIGAVASAALRHEEEL
jgi:hypothetical protein